MRTLSILVVLALAAGCSKDEAPRVTPSASASVAPSAPVASEEPLPPVGPARIDATLRFAKKDFAADTELKRPSPWLVDLPRIDAALPAGAATIVRESWARTPNEKKTITHAIGLVAASDAPEVDVARIARAAGALGATDSKTTAPQVEPMGDAPKKVTKEFRLWGAIKDAEVQVIARAVEGAVHVHVDVLHPVAIGEPALDEFARGLPEQATLLGLQKLAGKPAEAGYERAVGKAPLAHVAYLRVPSEEEEAEARREAKGEPDIDARLKLAARWTAKWEAPILQWLGAHGFKKTSPEQWSKPPHFRVVMLGTVSVFAGRE